jgi:hypothetical protein
MSKITKTLKTNSLLQRQLTRPELWELFRCTYSMTTEILCLSTFFMKMSLISGNMECDRISSLIYKNYLKFSDLNREFEQQLRMSKNPKIEVVAHLIKLDSEVKQILNIIRNMDLFSYYLIYKDNEKDKGFEQMKFKYIRENQSKTTHLKIIFKKSKSLGHADLKTNDNYLASFEKKERAKNAALLTSFNSKKTNRET